MDRLTNTTYFGAADPAGTEVVAGLDQLRYQLAQIQLRVRPSRTVFPFLNPLENQMPWLSRHPCARDRARLWRCERSERRESGAARVVDSFVPSEVALRRFREGLPPVAAARRRSGES